MGHLTLISEDVISALEHYPPDLRLSIAQFAPQPAWDEYVTGRYNETKKKDTSLLGGGKPVVVPGVTRNGTRWKVDEEDSGTIAPNAGSAKPGTNGVGEIKSEFRRAGSRHPIRESSANFGPAPISNEDEDEEADSVGPPQVSSCKLNIINLYSSSPNSSLPVIWPRRCSLRIILDHHHQMHQMTKKKMEDG
jgi:serine/threonine-protein phosphatase 6 regulatory subunit 3